MKYKAKIYENQNAKENHNCELEMVGEYGSKEEFKTLVDSKFEDFKKVLNLGDDSLIEIEEIVEEDSPELEDVLREGDEHDKQLLKELEKWKQTI